LVTRSKAEDNQKKRHAAQAESAKAKRDQEVAEAAKNKVARAFWRQGYATEIARYWVEFAFTQLRLPCLKVCPARNNLASIGVLRAVGATFEDDWLDEDTVIATITPD
ncbi:MAG: GNAT family N-acetyltransferase, partial [Pseudomonadota bacterium]